MSRFSHNHFERNARRKVFSQDEKETEEVHRKPSIAKKLKGILKNPGTGELQ